MKANLIVRGFTYGSSAALLLACASSRPPEPAINAPEPAPPAPLLQTQVAAAKTAAELKEPPLSRDYPCEQSQPEVEDNSAGSKKNKPRDAAKRDEEKKPPVNGRLPPEVIQKIVRTNYGKFRHCYEEGLRKNPNLIGKVTMRFVIGPNGDVTSTQPVCTSMPDREVVRCVTEGYKTLTFPQPEGGIVTVVYPIMFSPGD